MSLDLIQESEYGVEKFNDMAPGHDSFKDVKNKRKPQRLTRVPYWERGKSGNLLLQHCSFFYT